jgi:DNA polymerase III gamma/tau subunit
VEELNPYKLLLALSTKDVKVALMEIDKIVNFGADLEIYTQGVLENLRWLLLKKSGLDVLEDEDSQLKEIEGKFEKVELLGLINLFTKAALEIKTSTITQLPLELAVVEWCEGGGRSEFGKRLGESSNASVPPSAGYGLVRQSANGPSEDIASRLHSPRAEEKNDETSQNLSGSPHANGSLKVILERWDELLAGVKPLNHSVEALLRACRPIKLDGNDLTLEVFYKFHKERLETDKCRLIVEEVASQLLGLPVKLKCVLGEKKNTDDTDKATGNTDIIDESDDIIEVASGIFNGKIVD